MPNVIYNGNGATGSVPIDTTSYAANGPFTVTGPGGLTLGSSPFFYWNTKADGSGTIFGVGSATFPNQSTNLTLFAVWGVTTGLTNGGVTTHFNFFYDPSLGVAGGTEPARINQVLQTGAHGKPVIENDFDWLQAQFAGVDMTKARPFPIPVQVTAVVENGYNASWGWPLVMNAGQNASTLLRSMFISEVSETFMAAQDKGWGYSNGVGNEESCGEALSLFLTVQFQLSQGLGSTWLMNGTPSVWLNTSLPDSNPASTEFDPTGKRFGGPSTGTHYGSRQDYVGSVQPWAGNGPGTGACMAFLYYLFHQLQFTSIPGIIAAAPGVDSSNNVIGGSCLKGVYKNLTGDSSDPFPYFAGLLAAAYPPDQVASIPGAERRRSLADRRPQLRRRQECLGQGRDHRHHRQGRDLSGRLLPGPRRLQPQRAERDDAVCSDHRVSGRDDEAVGDIAEHLPSKREPSLTSADPVRL